MERFEANVIGTSGDFFDTRAVGNGRVNAVVGKVSDYSLSRRQSVEYSGAVDVDAVKGEIDCQLSKTHLGSLANHRPSAWLQTTYSIVNVHQPEIGVQSKRCVLPGLSMLDDPMLLRPL